MFQKSVGSLPSHAGLVNQAAKLNKDSIGLRTNAAGAAANLNSELDAARRLEADAEQVNCARDNRPVWNFAQITLLKYCA